jgi:MFS family permease
VLLDAPLVVLVPALVAAGVVAMSWNSLSFAAAVELAGHGRSGVAIGLQQTLLNVPGAAYPAVFGALVAATSWRVGFAVVALFPLMGWRVLRTLDG